MDIVVTFDDAHVASIVLDGIQYDYPWVRGTIVDGPALPGVRDLVEVYARADLELDYCPHHPDEGPYEETELAEYAADLDRFRQGRATGSTVWAEHWKALSPARLPALAEFVDHRRWRASAGTVVVPGIPLPPELDLTTRRFAFRP